MRKGPLWLLIAAAVAFGQGSGPVQLVIDFTPYVTYYVSSIDLSTGSSNVPIFNATLSTEEDSSLVIIEFEIQINSEVLDMEDEPLIRVVTDPFWLKAPIVLNNQDLTIDTRELFDVEGNRVPFRVRIEERIELSDAEELFNTVVQSGRLPDGIYRFIVTIKNGYDPGDILIQREEVINVSTPTYLQLMTPGSASLADTSINEIYTSYPVMQWESDPCNIPEGCMFYIRVAEFIPGQHATVEEAIESLTRLPLDQSQGWYPVGRGVTSFQYPATDAGELEQGKVYVWQVLKVLDTTAGMDGILSEIFAFKVKDFTTGGGAGGSAAVLTDPVMITLQSLIGEEQFNAIFGVGNPYAAYTTNGNVTLDGNSVDLSVIQALLSQGVAETDSLGNTTYHPITIISVEVEE
ncbi:MAG: hypothetical protein GXO92_00215 [FCB group bacterium]|nr:hypothetical protein [FCB group bacterium]